MIFNRESIRQTVLKQNRFTIPTTPRIKVTAKGLTSDKYWMVDNGSVSATYHGDIEDFVDYVKSEVDKNIFNQSMMKIADDGFYVEDGMVIKESDGIKTIISSNTGGTPSHDSQVLIGWYSGDDIVKSSECHPCEMMENIRKHHQI